jgi:hypothetical protein
MLIILIVYWKPAAESDGLGVGWEETEAPMLERIRCINKGAWGAGGWRRNREGKTERKLSFA